MPVTISGTSGVQLPLGSASAPSATNTTAQTTGVYYPTSTTLGLSTNGTNAVYIDASQNVGIGTTSPAASFSVVKQTTALSGTGNSYGLYMYPTSSGLTYIDAITNSTGNTSLGFRTYSNGTYNEMRMDSSGNLQFNSGYGSVATAYGCRAWVMFDSSSGTPTIRASGNVSSITDNGSGDFTVNMTNAMPDTYYAITGFTRNNLASPNGLFSFGSTSTSTKTTSACRVQNTYWNGAYGIVDTSETCVAIFR